MENPCSLQESLQDGAEVLNRMFVTRWLVVTVVNIVAVANGALMPCNVHPLVAD